MVYMVNRASEHHMAIIENTKEPDDQTHLSGTGKPGVIPLNPKTVGYTVKGGDLIAGTQSLSKVW